eukprot:1195096-Prorocentrum_minimum.AAC.2
MLDAELFLLDDDEERLSLADHREGGSPSKRGSEVGGGSGASPSEPTQTLNLGSGPPRPWSGRTSAEGSDARAARLLRLVAGVREQAAVGSSGRVDPAVTVRPR